ncbi:MAG: NADH:ubiquinone reductase (Na(+)-transporting) subunit C [Phaeodactylibacter xiamenensis]|uniref:Na(+)-translocating NADH-quinone reductase subunit C n=1 Tax=Phaeodactylibacter xiamenensis TaxID=1524460 RepID=A0A098SB51_9BACT|nr:NADH:ubiquinone reductase (Na(+)-transporting) subunit C [Phaeodactylibacter xiamenensis]KGE89366.1 NADH:ubiquinone oxidoreductase subunit C [Phaeodactylibacter xiamenensis]MCR9054091.1 NADH:ubiquinone reductase (Na(+)-transporting) subunit C [bacterium]
MESTKYVVIFILILTATVAVSLTGLREATKAQSATNEDIFNKRAILTAVQDYLPNGQKVADLSDEQVLELFAEMEQPVVDMEGNIIEGVKAESIDMAKERKKPEAERRLPVYVYEQDGQKFYILSVRGNGLWDEIWGSVALKSDLNTIAGATFDHKGETPGLGAEIKDNPSFAAQFEGKEIYEADGDYVSIKVRKGGARDPKHEVDGISGATVTADGVSEMLYRGLQYYQPYIDKVKQESFLLN